MAVLQLCRRGLICCANAPCVIGFRSVQVEAIRTGSHPSGRWLVSAFFLVVPGRRGVARRARPARRSRHGVALGPAVCARKWNDGLRSRLRPTNDSWRVDETYIRVKGKWVYLYRAVDSSGATIDFLLSAKRHAAAAAERFLAKALGGENHPAPRVINTDEHAGYQPAIVRLKAEKALEENCRHRPVQCLNNVLEQDRRAIKRRVRASQHFRSFWGAWRTISGYEAIHMIRKGQACWSAAGANVGLLYRFIFGMFGFEA